ncbi:tumor necrosis factor receptor superfamily member 14-like, partial [Micropterus dolomieu]|uniref:tumor necrosis factor receptor superfamily member 14-like n=1 Tax=Micropterus dolomieu TaxID=147949 RepID=UPI001E8E0A53
LICICSGTAFTDTECSDCSSGTFSNGTFTSCLPHTQCESIDLQLKAGTASTDAECGEQSSDRTGAVIAAAVGGILFLLISGAVAKWYLSRKRKKWHPNRRRKTNADSPQLPVNGAETSEILNRSQQQEETEHI